MHLLRIRSVAVGVAVTAVVLVGGCGDGDDEERPFPPSTVKPTAPVEP